MLQLITHLNWHDVLLPVILFVAWPLLWWRGSRRIRLWYAGLTPLGAVAGFVLGAVVALNNSACRGAACESGSELARSANGAMFDLGVSIMNNSVLALAVAVTLGLLTLVVELVLLGVRARGRITLRRSEDAPPSADIRR